MFIKILLIIYVISLLIITGFYFYNRSSNRVLSWSDYDATEKSFIVLAFLFAPFTALVIPFLIFLTYKENRRDKAVREQIEQEQRAELDYRQNALATLHKVKSAGYLMSSKLTLYISNTSNYYYLMKFDDNYPIILDIWKQLRLPNGATLHVEKCSRDSMDGKSELFVETPEGAYDLRIWDYILVEDTEEAAWEAYLLYNLWHVLPLFQHGIYEERHYLFNVNPSIDKGNIVCINKNDTTHFQNVMMPLISSPEVVKAQGKYYVSCCYFTNFGGLLRETVEVAIYHNKATFHEIENRTLVKYDCGIRF